MEIQIFGTRKCRVTAKAGRFFKDRQIAFHFVDLSRKAMSPGELKAVARAVGGFDALVDRESAAFVARGLSWMEFDPEEELAEHPELMKTPVVRAGASAVAGDDPAGWSRIAGCAGKK